MLPALLGLDWLRGGYAALAVLAVPLVLLGLAGALRSHAVVRATFSPAMRARTAAEASGTRRLLRVVCASGAVALFSVALSGPVLGYRERPAVRLGLDLVLCVDTSRSMLARDVRPDRLTRAKREVLGLFRAAGGDRFALVGFSGDARQVAPLSADTDALAELLERVTVEDNRVGGTDLGQALERALELLDDGAGASEAIVLITDGEDLGGRGRAVAERAAERGVRVYVVGIGTRNGGKIPVVGPDGIERFLVGPDGEEVQTRLEGDSLRALAEVTGGAYLSTESSATPLEILYRERVRELEQRELAEGVERLPRDRFQWPLALALLLAILEGSLRERRRVEGGEVRR